MGVNLTEFIRVEWSSELFRFYKRFPSAIRSTKWSELAALVNNGKIDQARVIATKLEQRPSVQRANTLARRMRIERISLFARMAQLQRDMRAAFSEAGNILGNYANTKATSEANIAFLSKKINLITGDLREDVLTIITASLRDAIRLGFKNMGNALIPIWKLNREELQIEEAPLSIGLDSTFAKITDPKVRLKSKKWQVITNSLIAKVTRGRIAGVKLSERIWEIVQVTRLDLKRIVTGGIATGQSSVTIANKIKKYLSPSRIDIITGRVKPGMYKSPFKNAMRIARTETNRSYVWAQAEYAKDKRWAKGVQVTLSKQHKDPDICDDFAARGLMTPQEFQNLIPAHPHCMCYPTIVMKDEFLDEGE